MIRSIGKTLPLQAPVLSALTATAVMVMTAGAAMAQDSGTV